MEKTLFELIESATYMLLDREPVERDLIYAIAKMDNEERAAIVLAYDQLRKSDARSIYP